MAQIILDSNNNLIQGDFDNATLNNRTKLQTTTTNATTNVYVVPNGSSTSAGVSVANNSSLTNASKIVMATNGTTDTQIISGVNGSGSYLPLSFYTNNTLAMQITTAGNIVVASTAAPAFSAYANAGQSLSSGVATKLLYGVEEFDTNNNFASSRFTPTVAGYYQINAQVQPNDTYTGNSIAIYKNGVLFKHGNFYLAAADGGSVVSALVYLNGTSDYVEIYAQFVAGQPVGSGPWFTYFQGFMARSA
jgi:hypothetical protein